MRKSLIFSIFQFSIPILFFEKNLILQSKIGEITLIELSKFRFSKENLVAYVSNYLNSTEFKIYIGKQFTNKLLKRYKLTNTIESEFEISFCKQLITYYVVLHFANDFRSCISGESINRFYPYSIASNICTHHFFHPHYQHFNQTIRIEQHSENFEFNFLDYPKNLRSKILKL